MQSAGELSGDYSQKEFGWKVVDCEDGTPWDKWSTFNLDVTVRDKRGVLKTHFLIASY